MTRFPRHRVLDKWLQVSCINQVWTWFTSRDQRPHTHKQFSTSAPDQQRYSCSIHLTISASNRPRPVTNSRQCT